jgi:hypothetical protein
MKKQVLFLLFIVSSLASAPNLPENAIYLGNGVYILGDAIYRAVQNNIDEQDYEILKQAVCEKMGAEFALKFNTKYPVPSKKSIEKLALCFDYNPSFWFWSNPPHTTASVGGQKIKIRGVIANILYDFLVTNANENPKVKALPCEKLLIEGITIDPVTKDTTES